VKRYNWCRGKKGIKVLWRCRKEKVRCRKKSLRLRVCPNGDKKLKSSRDFISY